MIAFNKNGLLVEFMCEKDNSQATVFIVNVKASNSSPTPMTEFVFQAAVPKVMVWFLLLNPNVLSLFVIWFCTDPIKMVIQWKWRLLKGYSRLELVRMW